MSSTKSINRDHAKKKNRPQLENEAIAIDLVTHLPIEIWFWINPKQADTNMYHFSVTYEKGLALDPVKYFADAKNRDLGIVKRLRKPKVKLIISPFPATERSPEQFFFPTPLKY
jgi:hypothetical protein